jgi:hypothetical protein
MVASTIVQLLSGSRFAPSSERIYAKIFSSVCAAQQMAKTQDRALIGDRIPEQLDASKAAHQLRIVERFLGGRIRRVEPVLHEVDAQHALRRHRWRAVTCLWIVRLDQSQQPRLGNHLVHLGRKALAAGHVALTIPGQRCKSGLVLRSSFSSPAAVRCTQCRTSRTTCAEVA